MIPRVTATLWIQALLRRCDALGQPGMVVTTGDTSAGAIFVKVLLEQKWGAGRVALFSPLHSESGERHWRREDYPDEAAAEIYLTRQRGYDADLWVVEFTSSTDTHPAFDSLIQQKSR